ncbi:MAG: hypothetical protein K8F60_10970 [Melioribacteraceae bacterium]|nr:hypothetical protein [Melioribacteraceae bacterium]
MAPKSFLIALIFLFSIILFIGCGENSTKIKRKSNQLSELQLSKSEFAAFVKELNSLEPENRKSIVENFISENPNSPVIENDIVNFYWYGKADTVLITGDLQNAWQFPDTLHLISCGDSSFFYKSYSVPNDSRLDYLLIVDGNTIIDPRNNSTTPSGYGIHSSFEMPGFQRDSLRFSNPNSEKGILDTVKFISKNNLFEEREIAVYTPSNLSSDKRLPVVFVIDGFKALEYSSYKNVLDNLIHNNEIIPLTVVFIDYKPADDELYNNDPSIFIDVLCDEILSFVESNYKISSSNKNRLICGISAGGRMALLTSLYRSDKFLNAAGQSTTISERLIDTINELNEEEIISRNHNFYIDVGRYDLLSGGYKDYPFLYGNQIFDQLLTEKRINHQFRIINDGHQWANWRERTDDILKYFFSFSIN